MIPFSGVIDKITGELLRSGFTDFSADGSVDPAKQEVVSDLPHPSSVRREGEKEDMDRWDGSAWVKKKQPPRPPTP